MLVALMSLAAHATTGLEWEWPEEGHRFLLAARLDLPAVVAFRAEKNIDLRSSRFEVTVLTRCAPVEPAPKRGHRLACTLEEVAIRVDESLTIEKDHIDAVLGELDQKLTGAIVQLVTDAEGHIKLVDLEGVDKGTERERQIFAFARVALMRSFALLDFELPKGGDDAGTVWRVTGSLAQGYPSEMGVVGTFPIDSRVESVESNVAIVKQAASGVVQSGETNSVNGVGQPVYTWNAKLEGEARFDLVSGRLIERSYVYEAVPTGTSTAGTPYVAVARLVALGPSERPTLPASGRLAD